MREYNNYPKNEIVEVKKPKLYLLTSKAVNLIAVFVACVSVSTFFATRYIGLGDIFFSANALSTMLAVAILVVILEVYDKKNAIKAFMAGSYAILLIFFISAFIPDFNPVPIGYYESSFINFHQKILLCVFVSYIASFLLCIKVYLYMKNEFNIPYLWIKATPAIALSQILYTMIYYFIYHGFDNLEVVSIDIKNELYLKFFMLIVCILIIYFIISGIRSGFFDLAKNIFPSHNDNHYTDDSDHSNIKRAIYEADNHHEDLDSHYSSPLYLEDYSRKRSKRRLPDFSEEGDRGHREYHDDNHHTEEEYLPRSHRNSGNGYSNHEHSGDEHFEENVQPRRNNRRAASRRDRTASGSHQNNTPQSSNINRSRSASGRARSGNTPHQNRFANQEINGNIPMQQVGEIGGKPRFRAAANNLASSNHSGNNDNSFSSGRNNSFGGNSFGNGGNGSFGQSSMNHGTMNSNGGRITPRSSQSFFVNNLTTNKTNSFSSSMNRNSSWNRR
ncbi:MAG: VUT family protein [Alphaproteobacteria bacterium]|nr:VUT family protein [Alphaproteobacteria bacterium]